MTAHDGEPTISLEERLAVADQQTLLEGLLAFNASIAGDPELTPSEGALRRSALGEIGSRGGAEARRKTSVIPGSLSRTAIPRFARDERGDPRATSLLALA